MTGEKQKVRNFIISARPIYMIYEIMNYDATRWKNSYYISIYNFEFHIEFHNAQIENLQRFITFSYYKHSNSKSSGERSCSFSSRRGVLNSAECMTHFGYRRACIERERSADVRQGHFKHSLTIIALMKINSFGR